MAHILTAHDLLTAPPTGLLKHWAYNSLDCTVTRGVWDALHPRLTPQTARTYHYELGMQAPAMTMMQRGVLVDEKARQEALGALRTEAEAKTARLNEQLVYLWDKVETTPGPCPGGLPMPTKKEPGALASARAHHLWPRGILPVEAKCRCCGIPRNRIAAFNPMSDDDVAHLLHGLLGVPVMQNKKGKDSVDKEVRERIGRRYPKAAWAVLWIDKIRRLRDQASVLSSTVSTDGRMRSTFGVGVADTGRWSSSANPFDEGTNLQNIEERLRYVFRADPGRVMFYADLEQAESCCVAYLAQDEAYINAHKSGDVHTYVCRLIWPEIAWTGELAADKKLAEELHPDWDKEHSYRYNSKRIQHGSNYLLTGIGLARLARLPQRIGCEVQERYFDQFPGIRVWQAGIVNQVRSYGFVVTPLGRRRQLFGRPWDQHTWKQAVAQIPQSMVADILSCGLWQIWDTMDPNEVWLMAQVHDALLGTVEGAWGTASTTEALDSLLAKMLVPVTIHGREMVIPVDCKSGGNWGKYNDKEQKGRLNANGLR